MCIWYVDSVDSKCHLIDVHSNFDIHTHTTPLVTTSYHHNTHIIHHWWSIYRHTSTQLVMACHAAAAVYCHCCVHQLWMDHTIITIMYKHIIVHPYHTHCQSPATMLPSIDRVRLGIVDRQMSCHPPLSVCVSVCLMVEDGWLIVDMLVTCARLALVRP